MKRCFFILLVSICGCSNPQKPNVYNVSVSYDELNISGNGYNSTTKRDTIHSRNDSLAYVKALITAGGYARAMDVMSAKGPGKAQVHYFAVSDSLGISLGEKLGVLKIEEINERVTVIDQEIKDKFLF